MFGIKYRLQYIIIINIKYSLGQYSVVRAIDNDDDPPVLPYNPEGVHKYSEHAVERRRGR